VGLSADLIGPPKTHSPEQHNHVQDFLILTVDPEELVTYRGIRIYCASVGLMASTSF
jgi:hypothetical protein